MFDIYIDVHLILNSLIALSIYEDCVSNRIFSIYKDSNLIIIYYFIVVLFCYYISFDCNTICHFLYSTTSFTRRSIGNIISRSSSKG